MCHAGYGTGVAARSLCGRFGTCLGVSHEMSVSLRERTDLRSLSVVSKERRKGYGQEMRRRPALTAEEMDAEASIRVVPPSFRSLCGA